MYASPRWSQVPGGADHPPGKSGVMRRPPPWEWPVASLMQSPPSPEEIKELVDRHARPSPESAKQDPSRRRTEIYMRNEEMTEHIKLREHADFKLNLIDQLRREENERTTDEKTKDKVNELIAANAATQATVSAMAADSTSMKAMLS